jgi:hypothetical protein
MLNLGDWKRDDWGDTLSSHKDDLIVLQDNKISTLWTERSLSVTSYHILSDIFISDLEHVLSSMVNQRISLPLKVNILQTLIHVLISVSLKNNRSQVDQVSSLWHLEFVWDVHDLVELVHGASSKQVLLVKLVLVENGGSYSGLLFSVQLDKGGTVSFLGLLNDFHSYVFSFDNDILLAQ